MIHVNLISLLATKKMGGKEMINKLKTFIAVAALSGTVGANVHAEELTVKKGDTLWDLSQVHNTSVENIKSWNHLSTDLIHPGDVLTIATEKHYTVKQDDTIWDIAQKFNVTTSQMMDWNNLTTDLIHPGLNLVVYTDLNNSNKAIAEKQATVEQSITPQSEKPANVDNKSTAAPASTSGTASKEITVKATAYTASCGGCSGVTATGINLNENPAAKVISVDPNVIPLGSKVFVEGYGVATAADTGGAIKGNRIDIFIPSKQSAINYGVKQVKVKILN